MSNLSFLLTCYKSYSFVAYDALSDEKRKAQYDQFGEEGHREDQDQGGHDPFDIFSQFFGGGRRKRSDEPSRGPDTVIPLRVSLRDIYIGKTLQISFRRETLCNHCHGTGAAHEEDVHQCTACNGQGFVIKRRQVGPGFVQQFQSTCDKCNGKGKVWTSTCPVCGGRRVVMTDLQFDVDIVPGAREGTVYEFEGYGDEVPGQEAGNLQFHLITNPDAMSRDGNDLFMDLNITLRQALVGFEKTFEHLDGHKVTLKRDEITPPRFVAVIKNEGMPIEDSIGRGDLHIKIFVEFPEHLTEKQKEGKYHSKCSIRGALLIPIVDFIQACAQCLPRLSHIPTSCGFRHHFENRGIVFVADHN